MGCASNQVDQAADRRRATPGSAFDDFGDEIRQELDPSGSLERLLAEYVIQAAWRLKAAIERQRTARIAADPGQPKTRIRPTATETAARSLREAFEAFEACRSLKNPSTPSSLLIELRSEPAPEIKPNEWPIVPTAGAGLVDEDETPHWRDRLIFDFEVSDSSPIVKGTWVTAGHVVSLIVDGWTWADILRSHPELTEDDVRACVTYAMDEENAGP